MMEDAVIALLIKEFKIMNSGEMIIYYPISSSFT